MVNVQNDYYNTQAYANAQKLQNATIDDIASKYGFNFSRDYANQQAETMAQAQRLAQQDVQRQNDSANKLNSQRITDDYRGAASSLDKGYFQQYLGQQQNQVNRGLNAGLAANQNLQLAMNKQRELGNLWRVRNQANQEESMRYTNTQKTIADALAQIEKERAMNAENLYQDGLYKGYDVLSSDRNYGLQLDNSAWGRYQDLFNNDMALKNYELAKSNAARAAAARAASQKAATQSVSNASPIQKAAQNYKNAVATQNTQTALDRYYNTPAINAVENLKAQNAALGGLFGDPVPPARSEYLTDWEKMKMLGL